MSFYHNWKTVPARLWRWPDFSPAEIACRGTGRLMVNEDALDKLQALRTILAAPMIVNSGYRSREHNKRVGGAEQSMHLEGKAFDISMANHDPASFIAAAQAALFIRSSCCYLTICFMPSTTLSSFRFTLSLDGCDSWLPVVTWTSLRSGTQKICW